jgi:hypothetical protein
MRVRRQLSVAALYTGRNTRLSLARCNEPALGYAPHLLRGVNALAIAMDPESGPAMVEANGSSIAQGIVTDATAEI